MKAMQGAFRLAKPTNALYPRLFQTASKTETEMTTVLDNVNVDTEWEAAKPYSAIPGPKPLPIPLYGNAWRMISMFGNWGEDMLIMHKELFDEYGPIVRLTGIGRADLVLLFDPADVEKMFRNDGVWPDRMELGSMKYYRTVLRKDFYEDCEGLVTSNGKQWGDFRSVANSSMMQPRNILMYFNPVQDVTDDFIERIRYIRNTENNEMPENFIRELNKATLETICVVMLNIRLGCLSNDLKPDSDAMKLINGAVSATEAMGKLELGASPWRYISTPTWRTFVKAMDDVLDVAVKYTNAKWKMIKNQRDVEDKPNKSILETLLLKTENPKIPIVMTTDAISGGIDMTSNAIATALYHLAVNPDKQELLFQELRQLLPKKDTKLTKETFNEMKYLRAVIKESMRLNPSAGANERDSKKDLVFQGYQVPAGTCLVSEHRIMCSLEKYFPDAEKFLPERWMKSESEPKATAKLINPFVFLPFGFGPRSCIGKRIAGLNLDLFLSKIIRNFQVRYDYGPMTWKTRLVTGPSKPLKFRMTDRPE